MMKLHPPCKSFRAQSGMKCANVMPRPEGHIKTPHKGWQAAPEGEGLGCEMWELVALLFPSPKCSSLRVKLIRRYGNMKSFPSACDTEKPDKTHLWGSHPTITNGVSGCWWPLSSCLLSLCVPLGSTFDIPLQVACWFHLGLHAQAGTCFKPQKPRVIFTLADVQEATAPH